MIIKYYSVSKTNAMCSNLTDLLNTNLNKKCFLNYVSEIDFDKSFCVFFPNGDIIHFDKNQKKARDAILLRHTVKKVAMNLSVLFTLIAQTNSLQIK